MSRPTVGDFICQFDEIHGFDMFGNEFKAHTIQCHSIYIILEVYESNFVDKKDYYLTIEEIMKSRNVLKFIPRKIYIPTNEDSELPF